jgi:hypothetical protein
MRTLRKKHYGTEDSSERPTHNITDDQNHCRIHTDDSDNTINKAPSIPHNTYLCMNYFAISSRNQNQNQPGAKVPISQKTASQRSAILAPYGMLTDV